MERIGGDSISTRYQAVRENTHVEFGLKPISMVYVNDFLLLIDMPHMHSDNTLSSVVKHETRVLFALTLKIMSQA